MGVVNVTPDSFSDGGCWADPDSAITHARLLVAQGADVIDVGGESTRPGAEPVSVADELARVIPVVAALAPVVRVSIDTMKPEVADAAVRAGASIVNDVSGSLALAEVASRHGVGWICMHMQGRPHTMQQRPTYDDVVAEVLTFLVDRADAGRALGVAEVWIDPGIGFGKSTDHNLSLLAHLSELADTGYPVSVGTSRKSSLGRLTARADEGSSAAAAPLAGPVPTGDRLEASIATAVWSWRHGASMVRVHDVAATVDVRSLTCGPFRNSFTAA